MKISGLGSILLICAVATTDIPNGGKLLPFARYARIRAEGARRNRDKFTVSGCAKVMMMNSLC